MSGNPFWDGEYDAHFYWLTTAEGERVKCYPNAGFMCALDGSKRTWLPEHNVVVEAIADDAPGGRHGAERTKLDLIAAAVMDLRPQDSGTFLGKYKGRNRPLPSGAPALSSPARTALQLGVMSLGLGTREHVSRDPAGTRGIVKASGKANPVKKAERKRQRNARRKSR